MQARTKMVQLVPSLSPPANGVGDYAVAVARRLRSEFAIDTIFVAASPSRRQPGIEGEFEVCLLLRRSKSELAGELERLAAPHVVLQLSPYGFEKNGCPVWLASGLADWRSADPLRRNLITMFHELYATGPIWTKAFWVTGLQRKVARDIMRLTSHPMATVQKNADWLEGRGGSHAAAVKVLAIPSGVGEPETVPPIAARTRRVSVFGIRAGSSPMSDRAASLLRTVIRRWSISEIAVIGESSSCRHLEKLGCPVVGHDMLAAEDVSRILLDSVLGLSWYPPEVLAKSSVFGSYCAHGVPVFVLGQPGRQAPSADGYESGKHFLTAADVREHWDPEQLQDICEIARKWYVGHGIREHARAIADYIHQSRQQPL